MTISNIFLKDKSLYLINCKKKSLETINIDSLDQNNKYNLIISDKYFFYLSIEVPSKSKNIRSIIWNYLKAQFPKVLVSNFDFISYKEKVIIFIFNEELKSFIEKNDTIFKRAKSISTPFLELARRKNKFLYKTEEIIYDFNNGTIELSFSPNTTPITEEDIIFSLDHLENDIEFSILKKKLFTKKEIISLASVLIISYSMFVGGNLFRLKATNLIYKKYNNILTQLYKKHGITDSFDPYGELLYKVSKISKRANNVQVSKILYNISISCPNNCIIDGITYQQNTVICYGHTTKLSTIDKLRSNLLKYFSSVEVNNTSKQNNKVIFSLKCKL